jgi:perosamine synthetase
MERIPVAGPWITQKEIDYVTDAVTHAWYGNHNMYHERFEKALARYLGVQHAVALPSCTSAIHLSLLSLGIGPGDEVIVPDVTWIATAAPIIYVGATPVFADIDPESWCLSAESFEECISGNTKAVISVDLYGNLPAMDAIQGIAAEHGIAIIEDAAEAIGSEYRKKRAGSLGDVGVFSFHGSKAVTTGEGGMLVTDRADIYGRALVLRDHGREPGDKLFWNKEVAYKYKMSSMQAALGVAQLERIEDLIEKKRMIFSWYESRLGEADGLELNSEAPNTKNSYWMVTAIVGREHGIQKEILVQRMAEASIDCRPFFYPLSSLPAFKELDESLKARQRNRISYQISPYGINLPSALNLTEGQVEYVCDKLKSTMLEETKRTSHKES